MAGYSNFKSHNSKFRNPNPYQTSRNYDKRFENATGNERFMEKVKLWTSFYRQYPFVFAKDYIGLNLKMFQKVLLYCMFHYHFFMFIAARGLGKQA